MELTEKDFDQHGELKRCNIEKSENGIKICRGLHDKNEPCQWEYFIKEPLDRFGDVIEMSEEEKEHRKFFDISEQKRADIINENSSDYVKSKETVTFPKGKKLYLEVEVEDSSLTPWLFKWLYGKNEYGENYKIFGCTIKTIHFNTPGVQELKQRLLNFIDNDL